MTGEQKLYLHTSNKLQEMCLRANDMRNIHRPVLRLTNPFVFISKDIDKMAIDEEEEYRDDLVNKPQVDDVFSLK